MIVDGTDLVLRGPVSTLPAGVVDEIREHKAELLAHLRRPAPLTRRDLARLAGDAAQAIWKHVESCGACPAAPSFGTIIAPIGCCGEGRSIWKLYRKAMADFNAAVEVN